jgi:phosphoribosylformylglycinamidine cyclo-ligase
MIAVVSQHAVKQVIEKLGVDGFPAWIAGEVHVGPTPEGDGFEQGAKGVNGGAVRLVGSYSR